MMLGDGLILLIAIAGLLLAVIWLFVPFAVFAIRRRLDAQLAELRLARQALERLAPLPGRRQNVAPGQCPHCWSDRPAEAGRCPACGRAR